MTWLGCVAALGCVVCKSLGVSSPAVVHHLTGHPYRGIGHKASDAFVVPLCPEHHNLLHRGVESFERQFGTQTELLARTILAVAKTL